MITIRGDFLWTLRLYKQTLRLFTLFPWILVERRPPRGFVQLLIVASLIMKFAHSSAPPTYGTAVETI